MFKRFSVLTFAPLALLLIPLIAMHYSDEVHWTLIDFAIMQCVSRGHQRCLLIADMPFMSYSSAEQALGTAGRLMKDGGAHMVKLEGGATQLETVRQLTDNGIPVCAPPAPSDDFRPRP